MLDVGENIANFKFLYKSANQRRVAAGGPLAGGAVIMAVKQVLMSAQWWERLLLKSQ